MSYPHANLQTHKTNKENQVRYIDARTHDEIANAESTYNNFQIIAGSITATAFVGTLIYGITSLVSAL